MSSKKHVNADAFGFDKSDDEDEDCESQPSSSTEKPAALSRPKRAMIDLKESKDEYDFSSHVKRSKKDMVPSLKNFRKQLVVTRSVGSYAHKWSEGTVETTEETTVISMRRQIKRVNGEKNEAQHPGSSVPNKTEDLFKVPTFPAKIRTGNISSKATVPMFVPKQKAVPLENQAEKDDFDYFMETLEEKNVELRLKELSFNGLVNRCVSYRFRNYLRSHSLAFDRIVAVMKDNKDSKDISLLGAVMFYIMSRDRNDFPKNKFVMSILVDMIKRGNAVENEETRKKAWTVMEAWHKKITRKSTCDFDENTINCENVAIVTLDYLACRNGARNSDVHDGLRAGGAFPYLVGKVHSLVNIIIAQQESTDKNLFYHYGQLEHLFRVHELLFMNKDAQNTITGINNGEFFSAIDRFVDFMITAIDRDDTRERIIQTYFLAMRATLNACLKNDICIGRVGGIGQLLKNTVVILCDTIVKYDTEKFHDIRTLLACLLIVLTESSPRNRRKLLNMKITTKENELCVMKLLTQLYNEHETKAIEYDAKLNEKFMEELPLENNEEGDGDEVIEERDSNEEEDLGPEEILHRINQATKGINKDKMANAYATVMEMAECHMNDSFVASYVALLIGVLINNNRDVADQVKQYTTNKNFASIIDQLKRFFEFSKVSKMSEVTSIERAIKTYETFNEDD